MRRHLAKVLLARCVSSLLVAPISVRELWRDDCGCNSLVVNGEHVEANVLPR